MSSWNDVPNEILQCILVKLAYTGNLYQCSQVNRKWFALCQAIWYKRAAVNVDFADQAFHTLIHSQFQCGQFAKYIVIKELIAPPYGTVNDLDPLVLLMERCPNVEEVNSYPGALDPERMDYFIKVLARTNNKWKFHTLPSVCSAYTEQFYRLADQMRDSLERLPVDGSGDDIKFDSLGGYRKLAHITLQAKDMTDCIELLKHAPTTLTRLDINFDGNMHLTAADNYYWNNDMMKAQPRSALKFVDLKGMAFVSDKDLLFMMAQFRTVNTFYLFGSSELLPTISTRVKKTFFEFLQGIPRHMVTLFVCDEMDWLESLYYGIDDSPIDSADVGKNRRRSILYLKFQNYSEHPYCTVSISSDTDNSLSYTTENFEIVQQKTKDALSRVGHQLRLFGIFLPVVFELNGLLEIILDKCSSLNRLTIGGGYLLTGQPQIYTNLYQTINQLMLTNVYLHEGALLTLSQSFPRFECLEIDDCEFVVNRQTTNINAFGNLSINDDSKLQMYEIDISMEHTDFGSIKITFANNPMFAYYEEEPKDAIFLSIFIISDKISEYYVKYGAKNVIEVETKEEFQKLEQLCNKNSDDKDDKITTVRVKVKSMKLFTFATTKHRFKLEFDDVQ